MSRNRAVPGYGHHRDESFARYYLRNVAVNEGCGCAESLLLRDRDLAASDSAVAAATPPARGLLASLKAVFGRAPISSVGRR